MDRAYPRGYVETKRALAGRAAVTRAKTRSARARAHVRTERCDRIEAGPTTPTVPAARDLHRPATTNSGRVTAMAIDPNCGKPGTGCRAGSARPAAACGAPTTRWRATTSSGPPARLATNAFGSLYRRPERRSGNTIYAGSGEPNGSGDSEAGARPLQVDRRRQDLVAGPRRARRRAWTGRSARSRSTRTPSMIYIGTDLARHGSSSVNGGRRTPPNAPALGVYQSTDGGASLPLADLQARPRPTRRAPSSGVDWFQGGVNKLDDRPERITRRLYAAVVRLRHLALRAAATWTAIFHTVNRSIRDARPE